MLQDVDANALSQRLSRRLREKGWGYQEFHKKVRDACRGARGSSYGSVWSYVNGKVTEPRPTVVRAMADVLDLRYEWLVSGDGPETREHAARKAALQEEPGAEDQRHLERLMKAMERARARLPATHVGLLSRRDHVLENLVIDLLTSQGRGLETYGEGEVAEAVGLVAWLLGLPLVMLGQEALLKRPGGGERYVMAMATALRVALPPSPEGRPLNALARMRRLRASWNELEAEAPAITNGDVSGGSTALH